jgi:hypothetical protein
MKFTYDLLLLQMARQTATTELLREAH